MKPSYILFSSSCPRLCFIPVFATFRSSGTETDECKNTLSVSVTEPRHDSRTIRYQPPLMSLLPVFSFSLFLFFFFFLDLASGGQACSLFIPETCARCCFEIGHGLQCLRYSRLDFFFLSATSSVSDSGALA